MPEWVMPEWNHKALVCWIVAVALLCAAAAGASDDSRAGRAKAIDSGGGVLLNDYDGHGHRTAPKRVGEIIGLWCESTTGERQAVTVRVFFEARELATKTLACPADLGYRRHSKIIRARHVGVYGMVLSGAGFDSYVIRTRVLPG